jgi:hypothetical protein
MALSFRELDCCFGTESQGNRIWSGRRGSNPRPSAWEADALPLSYSRSSTYFSRAHGPGGCSRAGAADAILGVMKYAIGVIVALAGLMLAGCGGAGGVSVPVPSQLASVCTQSASPAVDAVRVDSPTAGSGVQSPLKVTGSVNTTDGLFFIAVVLADGTHVIDYPGHSSQGGSLVPFSQQVPFSIFENTPACLWVSPRSVSDPVDAVRIPIVLEPGSTSTATQGGS